MLRMTHVEELCFQSLAKWSLVVIWARLIRAPLCTMPLLMTAVALPPMR